MPNYCQRCSLCGHVFEQIRFLSQWDHYPPCEKCNGPTEKAYVPAGASINSPAVVVFQAPDGSFRFPGSTEGSSVAKYEKQGFTRIDAKGWAEVRSLEKRLNVRERMLMEKRVERQQAAHEEGTRRRRSDVTDGLRNSFQVPEHDKSGRPTGRMTSVKLSESGRAIMRAAMARNDARPGPLRSPQG